MLRLAGARINPNTNGPHSGARLTKLTLKNISDGQEISVAIPTGAAFGLPLWSPDGKQFALTNTAANVELWIGTAATGKLRRVSGLALNTAFERGFQTRQRSFTQNRVLKFALRGAFRFEKPELGRGKAILSARPDNEFVA